MIKIGIKTLFNSLTKPSLMKFNGSKKAREVWKKNQNLVQDDFWKGLDFDTFKQLTKDLGLKNISNNKHYIIDIEAFFEKVKTEDPGPEESEIQVNNCNSMEEFKNEFDEAIKEVTFGGHLYNPSENLQIPHPLEIEKEDDEYAPFEFITVKDLLKKLKNVPENFKVFGIKNLSADLLKEEVKIVTD